MVCCLDDEFIDLLLDRPVAAHTVGSLVENLSAQADITMRNCVFRKSNSHLRFQSSGRILIENCEIGLPVLLTGDGAFWFESSGVRDMTIRDTSFTTPKASILNIIKNIGLCSQPLKKRFEKDFEEDCARKGIAITTETRRQLFADYLSSVFASFYQDMLSFMRNELGIKCLISDQNNSNETVYPENRMGLDFLDTHAYWDHPNFSSWYTHNISIIRSQHANFGSWIAPRLVGKPAAFADGAADEPHVVSGQFEAFDHLAEAVAFGLLLHFARDADVR